MIVRVRRSRWLLLGYVLVAVPMILLALDMLWAYEYYPRPETTQATRQVTAADGSVGEESVAVYTDTGRAQRRRDLGWGVVLLAAGSVLFAWAFVGVAAPRRLLAADYEGLTLWLEGRRHPPLRLAWQEIAEVRSGLRTDDAGEVPVLSLRLHSPERVPTHPRGAVAEPPWLHLFAGEWDPPAHEVAARVEGHVTGFRYLESYG
ncbi:MAG TPA: hypothetical protein VLS92_04425 [Acidimicrobiia bacterium]|nr:hypothetical protein [Acidimicrobiia bacterium]